MNKVHQRRIIYISFFLFGLSVATALVLYALKQNMNVFITPSQISSAHIPTSHRLRLGGMVKPGSLIRAKEGLGVAFKVTDFKQEIAVQYEGILPDLFREGKGVVAEGYITSAGTFAATTILAKHDENYMPKNVYQAIRENSRA